MSCGCFGSRPTLRVMTGQGVSCISSPVAGVITSQLAQHAKAATSCVKRDPITSGRSNGPMGRQMREARHRSAQPAETKCVAPCVVLTTRFDDLAGMEMLLPGATRQPHTGHRAIEDRDADGLRGVGQGGSMPETASHGVIQEEARLDPQVIGHAIPQKPFRAYRRHQHVSHGAAQGGWRLGVGGVVPILTLRTPA